MLLLGLLVSFAYEPTQDCSEPGSELQRCDESVGLVIVVDC